MGRFFSLLASLCLKVQKSTLFSAVLFAIIAFAVPSPSYPGSLIFVTTLEDKITDTGGCSLKEAIYAATLSFSVDGIHGIAIDFINSDGTDHVITTSCVAGTGDDTIVLPSGQIFLMNTIVDDQYNPLGPTATPIIFSKITIEANGSTLVWGAQRSARAFAVGTASVTLNFDGTSRTFSGRGNLTINNVYIKNFVSKGGNGATGGGGGLGAAGAIYVRESSLTINNSTFSGNAAVGGNGSSGSFAQAGGGGGLSGNGGSADLSCGNVLCSFQGGGGGGGSRGDGGAGNVEDFLGGFGGNGGGTVHSGLGGQIISNSSEIRKATGGDGLQCGASGGSRVGLGGGADGDDASCSGGGGGGGQSFQPEIIGVIGNPLGSGNGGKGASGGGGGGGGFEGGDGGDGGFGGGGGGGSIVGGLFGPNGGNGGFGGGGGAAAGGSISGGPGHGGTFGGNANIIHGGGGGALGGAIFNDGGGIVVNNSTFTGNFVVRGVEGGAGSSSAADNGADAGGAIFSLNGHLRIFNATISGNQSTGSGGGVVYLQTFGFPIPDGLFILDNSIIFNNGAMDQNGHLTSAEKECSIVGFSMSILGAGNLIQNNDNCPGVVTTGDPQLGPLHLNSSITPTMAIPQTSSAFNAADPTTSLVTDQRGIDRPQGGGFDIGAFELCVSQLPISLPCQVLVIKPPPDTESLTVNAAPTAGGTTNPAGGPHSEPFNSVVVLKATPKLGYRFVNWLGGVANPINPSTTVVMNQPQIITGNFTPLQTSITGNIGAKTGPQNARVWTLSLLNNGPGVANGATIHDFTLTQTFGTACTPSVSTAFPLSFGNLAPGQTRTATVTLNFTGCALTARFTAKFTYSANNGAVSGSVIRYNQYD